MKKATSRRRKRTKISNDAEVIVEAAKVLRTVGNSEAFYFYEAVGKPTGEMARSLTEFLDRVKSVKQESLVFHLERSDFQNWVEKILGDSELAGKLGRIPSSDGEGVRMSISEAVGNRIRELRESSLAMQAVESPVVLLSPA